MQVAEWEEPRWRQLRNPKTRFCFFLLLISRFIIIISFGCCFLLPSTLLWNWRRQLAEKRDGAFHRALLSSSATHSDFFLSFFPPPPPPRLVKRLISTYKYVNICRLENRPERHAGWYREKREIPSSFHPSNPLEPQIHSRPSLLALLAAITRNRWRFSIALLRSHGRLTLSLPPTVYLSMVNLRKRRKRYRIANILLFISLCFDIRFHYCRSTNKKIKATLFFSCWFLLPIDAKGNWAFKKKIIK